MIQTLKLLKRKKEFLSDLNFLLQKFNQGEVGFLVDEAGPANMRERRLLLIEHIFNEMKALERIVHQLEIRCDDFEKTFGFPSCHE